MDNNEYTMIYGNKCLDEVLDDFVKGIYSWKQVEIYMQWNGFDKSDISVNKVMKAHALYKYKKKGV